MRKLTIIFFMIICKVSCYAQAAYMHEIYEDSHESGSIFNVIEWIAGIASLAIFIPLAIIVIFGVIPSKFSEIKEGRKYKKRLRLFEIEATSLLKKHSNINLYASIYSSPSLKKWFIDGYIDGINNGRERKLYKPHSSEYEIITLEQYVENKQWKSFRKELISDGIEQSKRALLEGLKHGTTRLEQKGDARNLLD